MKTRTLGLLAAIALLAPAFAGGPPKFPNAKKFTPVKGYLQGTKTVATTGAVKTLQGYAVDNAHIAKALATYDKADLVRAVDWYKTLMDSTGVREAMLTGNPFWRLSANRYKKKNNWDSCATVVDHSSENLGTCGDVLEFKYRSFYNKFLRSPSGAPFKVDIQVIHSKGMLADHATVVLVPKGKNLGDYFNADGSWKQDGRGLLVLDSRDPHLVSLDQWRSTYFHSWSTVNFSNFLNSSGVHKDPSRLPTGIAAKSRPYRSLNVTWGGLRKKLPALHDPGPKWFSPFGSSPDHRAPQ